MPKLKAHDEKSQQERSVLLLDDDVDFVKMAEFGLARLNYEVVPFTDPAHAREAYLKEPSRFATVVTDVFMPGMTGLEFAETIRGVSDATTIIFLSGLAEAVDETAVRKLEISEVLTKPVTPREMGEALQRAGWQVREA